MLDFIFHNSFTETSPSVNGLTFLLSISCSFLLGLALATTYRYKTFYTKEFLVTLSLLPSLITLLIFLVNGNLGTGLAVAGTFSLVRFRSAAGGARELLAIFMAMIIGLSLGIGFNVLILIFSAVFLFIWHLYDKANPFIPHSTKRHLTVTLRTDNHQLEILKKILDNSCQSVELISIDKQKQDKQFKISYDISLNKTTTDTSLVQEITNQLLDIQLKLSKKIKKRKTL